MDYKETETAKEKGITALAKDCPALEEKESKQIVTQTMSFRSNRSMWENIEKEREQSKTLEQPKKRSGNQIVVAPDLLQDLLSVRSRSDSSIGRLSGRLSPGRESPDGLCREKDEDMEK